VRRDDLASGQYRTSAQLLSEGNVLALICALPLYNVDKRKAHTEMEGSLERLAERCALCGSNALPGSYQDSAARTLHLSCRRCGEYSMTWEAFQERRTIVTTFLRAATRQATELGLKRSEIRTTNWRRLAEEHEHTTVPENIEKLIHYFASKCKRPSKAAPIDIDNDYPIIDAENKEELHFYIKHLEETGIVKRFGNGSGPSYVMTVKGWDHYMGPAKGPVNGTCFVAMSFDPGLDAAYTDGIQPALVQCGYTPVCMKTVQTNDDISYRMLAEIRKAQFMVADFTGVTIKPVVGGVYYEAGFMRGLGREVFWTCRKDWFSHLHFDTNHFQHVPWTGPEDLRVQLAEKIMAVLGPGPRG